MKERDVANAIRPPGVRMVGMLLRLMARPVGMLMAVTMAVILIFVRMVLTRVLWPLMAMLVSVGRVGMLMMRMRLAPACAAITPLVLVPFLRVLRLPMRLRRMSHRQDLAARRGRLLLLA
jgi:hypothetical protein